MTIRFRYRPAYRKKPKNSRKGSRGVLKKGGRTPRGGTLVFVIISFYAGRPMRKYRRLTRMQNRLNVYLDSPAVREMLRK